MKTPRHRDDQSYHRTPVKAPALANADIANERTTIDPSLGAEGNVSIPQTDQYGDDLSKNILHIEHYVEPKFQAREVSAESSEL